MVNNQKDNCEECGRYILDKKTYKSKIDDRDLCDICYKSENIKINKLRQNKPPIINGLSNSMENKKKLSGRAKISKNNSYVIRGEEEILKKKYGNEYCDQFNKLKKALGDTRMKMIQDNSESIDRQKREKDLNKRLVEGLK